MNRRFLLKDETGKAKGYLVQDAGRIRYRIDSKGLPAEMTVFCIQGRQRTVQAGAAQAEQEAELGETVLGAVAHRDGRILMATDERVRSMFARQLNEEKAKAGRNLQCRRVNPPEEKDAEKDEKELRGAFALPERRWPRPCCMRADYICGRWVEKDEDQFSD